MRTLSVIVLITFAAAAGVASSSVIAAKEKHAGVEKSFEKTSAWKKLGSPLQKAWLDAKKSGDMQRMFRCFVRVVSPFDNGDLSFLISKGLVYHTYAGTIVQGDVDASHLRGIAELPFVASIRLAAPVKR